MNRNLKIAILKKYLTQSDFALSLNEHESKVSQIIRGRRKLNKREAQIWIKALECDPAIVKGVTK